MDYLLYKLRDSTQASQPADLIAVLGDFILGTKLSSTSPLKRHLISHSHSPCLYTVAYVRGAWIFQLALTHAYLLFDIP